MARSSSSIATPVQAYRIRTCTYRISDLDNVAMSQPSDLETLADLFPSYPRSDLAARLLCLKSLDSVVEELFREQDAPPANRKYSEAVVKLSELLPQVPIKRVSEAFLQCDEDFLATFDALMHEHTPVDVAEVCGLPQKDVRVYLDKHHHDPLLAIADIISNHKRVRKVWVSRVQDRKPSSLTQEPVAVDPERIRRLRETIFANTELKKLNYDFLLKLLTFFAGDLDRTVDVARLFVATPEITYNSTLGYVPKECPPLTVKSSEILKQKPLLFTAVTKVAPKVTFPAARPSVKLPSPPVPEKLDLHGYTVKEAVPLAKDALDAWWKAELDAREHDGLIDRHGTKVAFVEPFTIVTGRGLHSAGGARLRPSIIRLLNQNGYVYDENVGQLSVLGRRK